MVFSRPCSLSTFIEGQSSMVECRCVRQNFSTATHSWYLFGKQRIGRYKAPEDQKDLSDVITRVRKGSEGGRCNFKYIHHLILNIILSIIELRAWI